MECPPAIPISPRDWQNAIKDNLPRAVNDAIRWINSILSQAVLPNKPVVLSDLRPARGPNNREIVGRAVQAFRKLGWHVKRTTGPAGDDHYTFTAPSRK